MTTVLPQVRRLPRAPGVYRFRDARGRVLYIGRATDLRSRVASYWSLRDRPHLRRMVAAIHRLEALTCDSVHEAAWLERNLLEERLPRWNRTAGGAEAPVFLRLDPGPARPGLRTSYTEGFGPYLGGARARLALSALLRVHPLHTRHVAHRSRERHGGSPGSRPRRPRTPDRGHRGRAQSRPHGRPGGERSPRIPAGPGRGRLNFEHAGGPGRDRPSPGSPAHSACTPPAAAITWSPPGRTACRSASTSAPAACARGVATPDRPPTGHRPAGPVGHFFAQRNAELAASLHAAAGSTTRADAPPLSLRESILKDS